MLRKQRLLYLTADRLRAYSLSRGKLVAEGAFERNDAGLAAFSAYLAGTRNLYYLVIDVVEEDFHQDVIPHMGRRDRRQVLSRKLAQRYRDTSLTLSLSLGYDKGERRNERVLYASFSNTQQFQPWLAALAKSEVRLVGVYSTALLAPALIKRAGLKAPRCLLVSVQQTGLRQTYVEDGKIRFSRVGRLNREDTESVAATCAAESARLQQYLVTTRQLPTANTPIDVMVLAPERFSAALGAACRSTETLHFNLVSAETQCRTGSLSSFPAETPCDALFLHTAAISAPAEQFAQDQHRHYYRLWQFGKGLYAAGAAALAAGLLYAGADLIGAYSLNQQIQIDKTRFDSLSAEYARVNATFPQTPTSTENLKETIKQYRILQAQTISPAHLLLETSKVLAAYPQVEIDRIEWHVGKQGAERPGAKAAPTAAPTAAAPALDLGYELATISARVVGARRTDVRAITDMATGFIDAFKKVPQLQVSGVNMPFDTSAEDTFKGDVGSERAIAEDARFALTIGRRLGR